MKFITETGSVYEINESKKQIRRLAGEKDPTPRQGRDGEWRKYSDIMPTPTIGKSLMIAWDGDVPFLEETNSLLDGGSGIIIPITTTSIIVSIEEDPEWVN